MVLQEYMIHIFPAHSCSPLQVEAKDPLEISQDYESSKDNFIVATRSNRNNEYPLAKRI